MHQKNNTKRKAMVVVANQDKNIDKRAMATNHYCHKDFFFNLICKWYEMKICHLFYQLCIFSPLKKTITSQYLF